MTTTDPTRYLQQWRTEQHDERILTVDDDLAHFLATVDPAQVIRDAPNGTWHGMGWRELARRRTTETLRVHKRLAHGDQT